MNMLKPVSSLLSPTIHIQNLQTDLHTFPLKLSWENFKTFPFGDHHLITVFNLLFMMMYGYCTEKIDVGHLTLKQTPTEQ